MSRSRDSRAYHEMRKYRELEKKRIDAKVNKSIKKRRREKDRRGKKVAFNYGSEGWGSCGRKMRYRSRGEAERYIREQPKELGLSYYRCPYCKGYHLTSHPLEDGQDNGQ